MIYEIYMDDSLFHYNRFLDFIFYFVFRILKDSKGICVFVYFWVFRGEWSD